MFWGISFCVGNKTIEVNGQEFSLGELSAECLNITADDYADLHKVSKQIVKKLNAYETSRDFDDWFQANETLIQLDGMLRRYHLFRLLREDTSILSEAREFTQQYSLFDNVDCVFTEHDLSIMAQVGEYEDYLDNPKAYGGADQPPVPPIPPERTRACLIYPGNIETKWRVYRDFADRYVMIVSDIASFNTTIQNFIRVVLSKLEKMNANQYVAALYDFFNYERADKLIANPVRGSGYYFGVDTVELRHIPRETSHGSGEFRIYEYYEVKLLQALLKMDFYKALEAGYTIRKCAYCGRFFLLKDARHTKYCDLPSPGNPKYTCAQLGYHFKRVKEMADDNPRSQSLAFCERISSGTYDPSRGKLTTYLYPHIKSAMYRWLEQYQNEITHTTSISDLIPDVEIDEPIEFADKQSLPVDRVVYQKVCLELLQELFNGLSDKDKSILGHSFGVYGYRRYSLNELGLKEMLTTGGVIKARKTALLHLRGLYKESWLRSWKIAYRLLSEIL